MRRGGFVILSLVLLLVLVAALVAGAATWWWSRELPPLDKVTDYRPRQHLQVLTADGVEVAAFGSERRVFVPLAQMPPQLKAAVLAIEDTQFYEHGGISFKGLARAMLANLSGGMPQGASTITQQVARTFFLSTRRTPERKVKEAMLALQIERELGKDRILELYMNQIYLGQRSYGFGAAAQTYFGKPLAALSLAENAMLAGLPQNPIWANPVVNLERAQRRQRLVLARMEKLGLITPEQHAQARAEKPQLRSSRLVTLHAGHVAEMARQAVVERFGEQAAYTEGLRVVTSLRAEDQRAAHAALRAAVLAHERRQPWRGPEDREDLPAQLSGTDLERAAAQALKDHRDDDDLRVAIVLDASPRELRVQLASGEQLRLAGAGLRLGQPGLAAKAPAALALTRGAIVRVQGEIGRDGVQWSLAQWPEAEGAFVALDPASGRVRALVGGFDFNRSHFNRVTQGFRQPGSSFKPLLVAAAFERGVLPETVVDDLPLTPPEGASDDWNPRNSDGRFDGPLTVREAMVRSKNLVSIRLLRQLGVSAARASVERFGLEPQRQPDNLTLALGAGAATPLQMATAYGVFANGGWRVGPVLIEKIVNARGEVLYEAPPPAPLAEEQRVLAESTVFLVRSLLADVTLRGTAARAQAQLKRPDLYGKTGTTNDAVDAWFAGFAPGVVAVGWIGHDDPRSLGERESGGGLALPAWIDFMGRVLKGRAVEPLQPPATVQQGPADWRPLAEPEGGWVLRIAAPGSPADPAPAADAASTPGAPAGR
ncbi:MAG: PBP1A family penicillin-binding protein [Rubrivivax sp.]|nr:PBP1A family penicillin-binding protein [Rubrivivax sp.]